MPDWLGLGIGVLALLLGAASDQAPASEAVWPRLRSIESAFERGDATALRNSFSTAGKVRVELKDVTGGQRWYAPSQLQVIFAQIFEQHATRELVFKDADVTLASPGTAFARGRWVRRARHGGPESTETLTFTLCEEGGDWRILEIRSSR
jgi:hypothetical protein